MPTRVEFEGVVHEFPDDFSDADIAAALGGDESPAQSSMPLPKATATTGMLAGAAKAVPGIVSMVNKGATAVSALEPLTGALIGSAIPHVGSAVGAAAPKVAGMLAKATAPSTAVSISPFLKGMTKAGPLMRLAGGLSRAAGAVAGPALAMSSAYDAQQALIALANDPETPPLEREALLRVINRSTGGSRSR